MAVCVARITYFLYITMPLVMINHVLAYLNLRAKENSTPLQDGPMRI